MLAGRLDKLRAGRRVTNARAASIRSIEVTREALDDRRST